MARAPNVLESEPLFCYGAHVDAVRAVQRRLFIMSPLHSCWHHNQVRYAFEQWDGTTDFKPIFFLVKDHQQRVPDDFLAGLKTLGAIIVEIALTPA